MRPITTQDYREANMQPRSTGRVRMPHAYLASVGKSAEEAE
jgi:hypothetical protein